MTDVDIKGSIVQKYPKLFSEVGNFKTEMEIKLREGIQHFAQHYLEWYRFLY